MARFEGPGRRGAKFRVTPRLIAALVIALVGVSGYMLNTQVNPVTGEKQHVALSPGQEVALGLEAAPQMAAQMGGAIDPRVSPEAQMVERVGRRLVRQSDARKSPYSEHFEFHLLDDPETINAFALPGGQVFITRALFQKLETEDQLAGVLGHEIGHVIGRHGAEHMASGQLGQLLTMAVGVGAASQDDPGRGQQAAAAAAMANQMLQLKYGRDDESESDELGMRFMDQAGYDPAAILGVMRILKEAAAGARQPEFLSTHPLPETRIDRIRAILAERYPSAARRAGIGSESSG